MGHQAATALNSWSCLHALYVCVGGGHILSWYSTTAFEDVDDNVDNDERVS